MTSRPLLFPLCLSPRCPPRVCVLLRAATPLPFPRPVPVHWPFPQRRFVHTTTAASRLTSRPPCRLNSCASTAHHRPTKPSSSRLYSFCFRLRCLCHCVCRAWLPSSHQRMPSLAFPGGLDPSLPLRARVTAAHSRAPTHLRRLRVLHSGNSSVGVLRITRARACRHSGAPLTCRPTRRL